MAKSGRRPQKPYVTMWHEVVAGLRKVVKETDSKGDATVWHLYPTGKPKPYFGTVRHGDVASERRAIRKFIDWQGQRDGLPSYGDFIGLARRCEWLRWPSRPSSFGCGICLWHRWTS